MQADTQHKIVVGQPPMHEVGTRDAVHVPVIVCVAHCDLYGGSQVGINTRGYTKKGADGVVDPFIDEIYEGDKVLVFLNPADISGVRHTWEHNTLDLPVTESTKSADGERKKYESFDLFMEETAKMVGCNVNMLKEACDYAVKYDTTSGGYQVDWADINAVDWKSFWRTYNKFNGTKVTLKEDPFCC